MADQQLAEYESQLADIEALLEADPTDESVQKLKADLVELIELTKSEQTAADAGAEDTHDEQGAAASVPVPAPAAAAVAAPPPAAAYPDDHGDGALELPPEPAAASAVAAPASPADPNQAAAASSLIKETAKPKKKKSSKSSSVPSQFEVPAHLQPLPSDTDAERKKKTRAIKALKSKWREKTKEVQTIEKQKSWKDFVSGGKKKKKRKGVKAGEGSIFATEDGVNARTGVVGGGSGRGSMTEYGDRKRQKY